MNVSSTEASNSILNTQSELVSSKKKLFSTLLEELYLK
ncbi:hypothetical protein SHLO109777_04140 [Shewanella loihica]